ncbi:tripartite tricarboxylate transporter substrate binding protein [Pigmentiphaga litoralis]|uniref:Tripartite-type tricarboxylate transporter receptor subunit TctC n=1 Tax=Pigmentiphaga litoralis TaxID=516702 RepID=A0A7Y9IS32_9BURK|nr:tripartite tricarboxylate transporter substrate binding protein [Pigmentiphaga litoralis]NYE25052.1 tripartite-type tricarboxylate transporter receptor subunit TctC [Pigmentiphaga litoralis]NYE81334.1 tripartite-type tricarboxylate transporter receptor subunit TctC [Pigmentiphaga litoralis]
MSNLRPASLALASVALAGALALAPLIAQAQAQAFPDKPIHIIVPLPPGGSNDVLARIVGQEMSKTFGQPVIVENKPGAAGNIATDYIAKSAPDGYTIAIAPNQTVAVNPVLYPKLPFDASRDLTGVTMMGRVPLVLVVPPQVKANSVADVIAMAKASPDKLTFATAGSGSPQHMSAEIFKSMTGVRMTQVPYRGSVPALVDVLAGTVDMMFCPINSALPYIRSGKLRALGITGEKRLPLLPDVPTIAETLPGYESDIWIGMIAPAKTPAPVIAKLNTELRRALALPEVKDKLAEQGIFTETSTPEAFTATMAADQKRWAEVIKNANIRPE